MLAANAISYSYRPTGKEPSTPVLRSVSCVIVPGRVLAIVGPNGAGKSTLLKLFAGVLDPAARPSPELDDVDVSAMSPLARAHRIAYVPQQPAVPQGFTTSEVVRFGATLLSDDISDDVIDKALASVDLAHSAAKLFAHLSAGQRQRAALARAFLQLQASVSTSPKYLLADEPVSAQDPGHSLTTLSSFQQLSKSQTHGEVGVAVVLHDLSLAARFADDALVLTNEGTVAAQGLASDVLTPSVLTPVFQTEFVETIARSDTHAIRTLVPMNAITLQ